MSKITKCVYNEMSHDECSPTDTGNYYFYLNLLSNTSMFNDDYIEYEKSQHALRDKCVRINRDKGLEVKSDTAVIGIGIRNTVVSIIEL